MFFGFFDKRKRKRKNDEDWWYGTRRRQLLQFLLAAIVSMLVPMLVYHVAIFLMGLAFLSGGFPGQDQGIGPAPTPTPDPRIFDSRFVVSDNEGRPHNFPAAKYDFGCEHLAVSPDRKQKLVWCAWVVYLSNSDQALVPIIKWGEKRQTGYPVFNRDGTVVNYILYEFENGKQTTHLAQIRLTPEISQPILLAQVRSDLTTVPPVADPSTGWLLVAEPNDDHTTTFSTIRDTPCVSPRDCEIAKHTIAVVPGEATTADFLPDGTAIIYTDDSALYSVATRDGTRTKIVDVKDIRKIAFNRDGSLLALVDGSRNLYTAPVNNLSQLALVSMPTTIWTFAWVD